MPNAYAGVFFKESFVDQAELIEEVAHGIG